MQPARRLTSRRFAFGASNVGLADEIKRAPSRHCREARVYGHMTAAMHDMSTPSMHGGSLENEFVK